ncbi:MAG: hypothetical protein ABW020_02960 [Candidatus Rokuibacteriota bacterium]
MPTFEIDEDAVNIAVGTVKPVASSALPPLSVEARGLLQASQRVLQAGGAMAVRRITADRGVTRELRDWFINAEETLALSAEAGDRALSRICAAAANVLIRVFAAGGYGPRVR